MTDPPALEAAIAEALGRLADLGFRGTPALAIYENGVPPAARAYALLARVPLPRLPGHCRVSVGPAAELAGGLAAAGGAAGRRSADFLGRAAPDLWLVGLTAAGVQIGVRGATGTVMAGVFAWDDGSWRPSGPGDSFLAGAEWGTVSLPGGSAFAVYAPDPRTGALARMLAQAAVSRPRPVAPQPAWDDCPFCRRLSDDGFEGVLATYYARHPEAVAIALDGLRTHDPDAAVWLHDILGRRRLLPVRAAVEALLEGC